MLIGDAMWPAIRDCIAARFAGSPWPPEYVELDLSWHASAGVQLPGRPTLIARWGWTDHRVKALIASRPPADRQPTASASPATERTNLGNLGETASRPPAHHQPVASRPPAETDSAHDRQRAASGGTLQPTFCGQNRQPTASEPEPDQIRSSFSPSPAFQDQDRIGSRATHPALFAPPPPAATTEAGARFAAVLGYWSSPTIRDELRWEVDLASDVPWFEELVASPPYALVDTIVVLDGWDDFLRRSYTSRLKNPAKLFVSDWRTSVKRALRNGAKPPATGAHHAPASPQRGAFGATRQRFDIPVHTGHENADEAMDFWRNGHE